MTPSPHSHELYSVDQVRALDRRAIDALGIPGIELMRRAAAAAFASLQRHWPRARRIAVYCGPGNNGGDGFLLGALALQAGYQVMLFALSGESRGDAAAARGRFEEAGGQIQPWSAVTGLPVADVHVDALYGTGLARAPEPAVADLLWRLRSIKSDAEVAYIAEADRINGEGLRAGFGAMRAGDTEVDASRKVGAALVEAGAYRPPYAQINLVSHAKHRALGHRSRMLGPIADYALAPGDLLFVDAGVVVGAYWGEFNRMAVVGEPSDEQRRHHDAIREVVARSVDEALKPGVGFRRVIEQMAGFYRDCGYGEEQFSNYLGPPFMHLCHGLGLASSEPPFVRFDSDAVLEPGMVLSCEAYLRADSMTYGSEEDVVITRDGCRVLSDRDPGLYVLEAA